MWRSFKGSSDGAYGEASALKARSLEALRFARGMGVGARRSSELADFGESDAQTLLRALDQVVEKRGQPEEAYFIWASGGDSGGDCAWASFALRYGDQFDDGNVPFPATEPVEVGYTRVYLKEYDDEWDGEVVTDNDEEEDEDEG